jgi:magnesium chelatase family protein
MNATVYGASLTGAKAELVTLDVGLLNRLPAMSIAGLPAAQVREHAERVRSAITETLIFPRKRVTVELLPIDTRKQAAALDLAMAIGVLIADGQLPPDRAESTLLAGELSLGSAVRPVRGVVPMALLARHFGKVLMVDMGSVALALCVPGVQVIGVRTLRDAIDWMAKGEGEVLTGESAPLLELGGPHPECYVVDFADVRGHENARYGLEIAATGGHHVALVGLAGCGKTMLAQRLTTILPPMTEPEGLEVAALHSAAGLLTDGPYSSRRPFRAPHYSVDPSAMHGGTTRPLGEISLAHRGVLLMDEAPEFTRMVLDMLVEPLKTRELRITLKQTTPADFMLVLSSNPCPCGREPKFCTCTQVDMLRYQNQLVGLHPYIEVHIPVETVSRRTLLEAPAGESSAVMRERVIAGRQFALDRGQTVLNGQLTEEQVAGLVLAPDCQEPWPSCTLRVARTLADLEASPEIHLHHIEEALRWSNPRYKEMA